MTSADEIYEALRAPLVDRIIALLYELERAQTRLDVHERVRRLQEGGVL